MKKPKGQKYRNLYVSRGTIWYERVSQGRRYRVDTELPPDSLASWQTAALFRDKYEEKKRIGTKRSHTGAVPTFAEMAARYLEEDTQHLAATTQVDRNSHLREGGPILKHLGRKRLDDITPATLREWWNVEIQGTERAAATGQRYVASMAGVFNYALELGFLTESPVDLFRRQLTRRARSKQGRAAAESKARPVEDRRALESLVREAKAEGPLAQALVVCLLDAGLRLGEALALEWRSIAWGVDEEDTRRHLLVSASRSRDGDPGAPKSGRRRRVQLSKRLRGALIALFESERPTTLDSPVFGAMDGGSFREEAWQRILTRADLVGVNLKDLRDTYASQLVSSGISLKYVSLQLGHSTTAVTEAHYARWIPGEGDFYVEPLRLGPGEVPADLLTRLPDSPHSPHKGDPYALPDSLKSPELH